MAILAKTIIKGDRVILRYQLKENGSPKNITGMTFKLGVKEGLTDTTYKIGPKDGVIDEASQGKFSFTLTSTDTASVFSGVMEIAMYDAVLNRTTLTPAKGVSFVLVENIID